jgi:hypothetical protein
MAMEKKALFVKELGELWEKNSIHCVEKMEYIEEGIVYGQEVLVHFQGGAKLRVNVNRDSPQGILYDIIRFIDLVGTNGIDYE